jgi:hypothetical protein
MIAHECYHSPMLFRRKVTKTSAAGSDHRRQLSGWQMNLLNLLIVSLLIAVIGSQLMQGQQKAACTTEDAMRAEAEASSLKTWNEVYNSYKRFAQCDDAAIGEGYSGSVSHLLADDWKNMDRLNQLASRDKGFEKFVLFHLDELMSPAEQRKIRENASIRCPAHAKKLCGKIDKKVK